MKSIACYLDYREFLSDFYVENKKRYGFTWREFAKNCGFASPVYLKQVIDGKYNLSEKAVTQVIDGMQLVGYEREYFAAMVDFCHAEGLLKKQEKLSVMLAIAEQSKVKSVELEKFRFFESYLNPLIRELAPAMSGATPREMANACRSNPGKKEVADTLKFLLETEFLTKDEKGCFVQTDRSIAMPEQTPDGFSAGIPLHRQMGELALKALDFPRSERNMTGLTLGMSRKTYAEVVKVLAECRRKIVALVQRDPVVEHVYRLNMQLFPLADVQSSSFLKQKHASSKRRKR